VTETFRVDYDARGRPPCDMFIGRSDEIGRLEKALLPAESGNEKTRIFVIHGLGGMGKSQLAAKYADMFQKRYSAVFWVDGSTKEKYQQQVAELAFRITGAERCEYQLDSLFEHVIAWFRKHANDNWLLIVDNVDRDSGEESSRAYDLYQLLPLTSHGSILITTRDFRLTKKFQSSNVLHLKELNWEDSMELLLKRSEWQGPVQGTVLTVNCF